MPISNITQILLRLFSLKWFLTGVIQIGSTWIVASQGGWDLLYLIAPLAYLIVGALCWKLSPYVSRLVAKGIDETLTLEGVNTEQLYSAILIGLGVYFTLDSFAPVISWVHFFSINDSLADGFHQNDEPSYYDLADAALTLIAGIALILTARRWAERLCRNNKS